MAEKVLKTRIQLLRKTEAELLVSNPETLQGEIYIVDVGAGKPLRYKIGEANKHFSEIGYFDNSNGIIINGYLLNNEFYEDSTYQVKLEKSKSHLYIDHNSNDVCFWDGTNYNKGIAQATSEHAGIMKLYDTNGTNTDGAMTQKSVTDGVKEIKFAADGECLVLDLPW